MISFTVIELEQFFRYSRKDILNRLGFYVVNRVENIWI